MIKKTYIAVLSCLFVAGGVYAGGPFYDQVDSGGGIDNPAQEDLDMGGNDITNAGTITATTLAGTLSTAAQANVTSLGTLTGLTMDAGATVSGGAVASAKKLATGTTDVVPALQVQRTGADAVALTDSSGHEDYHLGIFTSGLGNGAETGLFFTTYGSGELSSFSATRPGAAITHERVGSFSQGKLHFKTRQGDGSGSDTMTAMTIDHFGEVGIGTKTPEHKLHVLGDALIRGTNAFGSAGEQGRVYLGDANNSVFAENGAGIFIEPFSTTKPFFVEQNTGNVGIGTDEPSTALHVVGSTIPGTVEATTTAEPHACDAGHTGAMVYVDDTDDSGAGAFCGCIATGDDGAGAPNAFDWVRMDDHSTACPFF